MLEKLNIYNNDISSMIVICQKLGYLGQRTELPGVKLAKATRHISQQNLSPNHLLRRYKQEAKR